MRGAQCIRHRTRGCRRCRRRRGRRCPQTTDSWLEAFGGAGADDELHGICPCSKDRRLTPSPLGGAAARHTSLPSYSSSSFEELEAEWHYWGLEMLVRLIAKQHNATQGLYVQLANIPTAECLMLQSWMMAEACVCPASLEQNCCV